MTEELLISSIALLIGFFTSAYLATQVRSLHMWFIIRKSWALYLYAIIHGIFAFVISLLAALGIISLGEQFFDHIDFIEKKDSSLLIAITVGFFIRRILLLKIDSENFIQKNFLKPLWAIILIHEFNALRIFLRPYYSKYPLEEIKKRIKEDLELAYKDNYIEKDKTAHLLKNSSSEIILRRYLKLFGRHNLDRLFPI